MNDNHSSGKRDVWRLAEQFFGGSLPFTGIGKFGDLMHDSAWLDQVINETLQQAMPAASVSTSASAGNGPHDGEVFETHRSVTIRMNLPPAANPHALRVYVSPAAVRVEGLPDGAKRKFRLPREVGLIGIRSLCKDGVLEIRMPKRKPVEKERQITINVE